MKPLQSIDVAKKYHFPLAESIAGKLIVAPVSPVNVGTVLSKTSYWKDDPFDPDYYKPMCSIDHAQFTSDLLKSVHEDIIRGKEAIVNYPITVKTTKASRSKARSKFFTGGKALSSTENLATKTSHDKKATAIEDPPDISFLKKLGKVSLMQRTKNDQAHLARLLRIFRAFDAISNVVLEQMCNVGSILYTPEKAFICDYTTTNSIWYCILKGSVLVEVTNGGSTTDNCQRNVLRQGEQFGTLELKAKSMMHGMVTALEECIIFRIDAHDYFIASTFAIEKAQKAACVKIKSLSIFDGVSKEAFKSFAVMMVLNTYKQGDLISKQHSDVKKAAVVVDGVCSVKARLPDGSHLSLGRFKTGDYFGEQLWIKNLPKTYTFSVIAQSMVVNIAFFNHSALQSRMEASKYTLMTQTPEILEMSKVDAKIEKIETEERKRQIIRLLREKKGDPRISTIKHCNELYC